MKIFSTIKFFMNPAPYIFLSLILGFLSLMGVGIPFVYIVSPVLVWFVYFCFIIGLLLWIGFKSIDKAIEVLKSYTK